MTVMEREHVADPVEAVLPLVRDDAEEAERQGHLTDRVVEAMTEAGLFRMLTPRSLGGLEADPIDFYRAVEAVAHADGSAGWCLFIQGGVASMGAMLDDATAEEVFGPAGARISGTVFPFGRAVAGDGSFTVSGRWSYASGCRHATSLITFCAVFDGDAPRPGVGDMPEMRVAILPRSDVTIHETWDVSGLVATGSHDLEVTGAVVPERRTWLLGPTVRGPRYQAPMYQMPFMAFFAWPMAAVALGIAQRAIDAVTEMAGGKTQVGQSVPLAERPLFQMQLAQATARVRSARAWLHQAVEGAHARAVTGAGSDLQQRTDFLLAAVNATQSARDAVELAYAAGGGTANYRSSVLQRCLRDIHAVTQHVGTSVNQYEEVGRQMMGAMPRMPLLLL